MFFKKKLQAAVLLKRYKRFLADVVLNDESVTTVYCPNTGSMRSCSTPGSPVYLSRSDNPKRKYPLTLEMISEKGTWVGVNTSLTNALVVEAIENQQIAELENIDTIKKEVKTSPHTRLDLKLSRDRSQIYVEIKNCSLVEDGVAMFPDAITTRGTKHLLELADLIERGHQGVIFYLVQRSDAVSFSPAAHIDARYAEVLAEVVEKGVTILVYQAEVSPNGISVVRSLPYVL